MFALGAVLFAHNVVLSVHVIAQVFVQCRTLVLYCMCGDFEILVYELVCGHASRSSLFSIPLNCSITVVFNRCFEFLSENFNSIHAFCTFDKIDALL